MEVTSINYFATKFSVFTRMEKSVKGKPSVMWFLCKQGKSGKVILREMREVYGDNAHPNPLSTCGFDVMKMAGVWLLTKYTRAVHIPRETRGIYT